MNLSNIRQKLDNINYSWDEFKTYLILVPGLSLTIQKIQLANTLPLVNTVSLMNANQANVKAIKFAKICKWHLRGSMIQIAASIIAMKAFDAPFFSLFGILATYEMLDTLITGLKNPITIYEFYPNGTLKKAVSKSACNIF